MAKPKNIRRKKDLSWNESYDLKQKIDEIVEKNKNWTVDEISLFLKQRTTNFSLATNNEMVIAAYLRLTEKIDNPASITDNSFKNLMVWIDG